MHVVGVVVVLFFGDDFVLVDVGGFDMFEVRFSVEWIGLGEVLVHLIRRNLFGSEWEVCALKDLLPFFLDGLIS